MESTRAAAWQSQDHVDQESVLAEVPGLLRPIMEHVSNGRSAPKSGLYADEAAIGRAIAAAVGRAVKRVELVSYAASSQGAAWMRKETYAETLAEALEHRLGFGLSIKLGGHRWKRLREECGYEEPMRLADFLAQAAVRIPKDNLRASVFAVTGFVLAQDAEMAATLRPLLRLMPHAIPLGEARSDAGTWLVLVP